MKKNKVNIDELVKASFDKLDAKAPPDAWQFIEGQIQGRRRSAFLIVLPWAAAITMVLAATFIWLNHNREEAMEQIASKESAGNNDIELLERNTLSDEVVERNQEDPDAEIAVQATPYAEKGKEDTDKKQKLISGSKPNYPLDVNKSYANAKAAKEDPTVSPVSISEQTIIAVVNSDNIGDEKTANIPDIPVISKKDSTVIAIADDTGVNQVLDPKKDEKSFEFEDSDNKSAWKWGIAGNASPTYSYRRAQAPTEDNFYNWGGGVENSQKEQPLIAYSAGVNFKYGNDRWSFTSGVYYLEQGQFIENFNMNKISTGTMSQVLFASTSIGSLRMDQNQSLVSGNSFESEIDGSTLHSSQSVASGSNLTQRFEYLEIPFYAKYKFIDRWLDLELVTGFSTSFLIENNVTLEFMDELYDLGSVENVNDVNYNSVIGMELLLPITRKLRFQLQPLFRYSLSQMNKDYSVEYHPYTIAVYTGITLDF